MSDKENIRPAMSMVALSVVSAMLGFFEILLWVLMAACVWLILW